MDGNGRWAKKHLLSRIKGHEKGAEAVRTVVRACRQLGIAYLTLYAFSTENWQRPQKEVNALMTLLIKFLKSEQKELAENDIR
ncbi:MAG: polyprenyl diphosphate synthase, partial [Desulfobacterales bacterium]